MDKKSTDELTRILREPSASFSDPCEVLCQGRLTFDDKIAVLQKWRRDLLRVQGGAEHGTPDDNDMATIRKIDDCLRQLYV